MSGRRLRESGVSLILAMLMLVAIGLSSTVILRNAASGAQVAGNHWFQTQAHQYAQLALRFCVDQLSLPVATRAIALVPAPAGAAPAWSVVANWSGRGAQAAHTLAGAEIGGPAPPRVPPQCLAEATDTVGVYTVTARGFSADFRAEAESGVTRSGAVAWLQATLLAQDAGTGSGCVADCGLVVRRRLWQQLLTPPF